MKKLKQRGFTFLEVLLILIIVILVNLIGSFVWYRHYHSGPIIPTPHPVINTTRQSCATESELSFECEELNHPPTGWTTYTSTHSTIRFLYPDGWQFKQVSLNNMPSYYLEDVTLTGPNNFILYFILEAQHVLAPQNFLCAYSSGKLVNIPINNQYIMVVNATLSSVSLAAVNQRDLIATYCGNTMNAASSHTEFSFNGGYTSSFTVPATDVFLNQPEVQTAKTIFASLHQ